MTILPDHQSVINVTLELNLTKILQPITLFTKLVHQFKEKRLHLDALPFGC